MLVAGEVTEAGDLGTCYRAPSGVGSGGGRPVVRRHKRQGAARTRCEGYKLWESSGGGPLGRTGRAWAVAGQTGTFSPPKALSTRSPLAVTLRHGRFRQVSAAAAGCLAVTTPGDGDFQTPPLMAKPPRESSSSRPPPPSSGYGGRPSPAMRQSSHESWFASS